MRLLKVLALCAVASVLAGCVNEKPRMSLSNQQALLAQDPLDGAYEGKYDISGAMMSYTSPSRLIIKTRPDGKLDGTLYSGYHKIYFRLQEIYLADNGKTVKLVFGSGQRFERRFTLRREGNTLRGDVEVVAAGSAVPAIGSASFVKVQGLSEGF